MASHRAGIRYGAISQAPKFSSDYAQTPVPQGIARALFSLTGSDDSLWSPADWTLKWTLWTELSILTGRANACIKTRVRRQNTPSFTLEALGRETAALSFVTSLRIARHMALFDFLRRRQSTQDAPQHLLRPTYLLKLIAVFFLYFIAGKLGLSVPFTSGNVSPVWPASGIALAAVLLWGSGVWPGIAAGAFLVNFCTPVPAPAALGIALGNTSGALVGGYLLRRFADSQFRICRLRDLADLIFLGALVSTSVAATLGATTLFLAGVHAWSDFGTAWRVWWFGDAMGVLVVAPLLLTARELGRVWQARALETLLLFLGTTVTSLAIFSRIMGLSVRDDVLAFAVFPFVIWGAIRFRSAGAASICFVIAVIAVWGTGRGFGPFVSHSPVHNAVLLQLFLAVISITALTLSAVMSERTQAEYALRRLSGRLLQLRD
jgi:integral membrane sensor domain MASE1